MLSQAKSVATVATADVSAARRFYGETLGLDVTFDGGDGLGFLLPDGSALSVYARPAHRPADHTSVTFIVPDVPAEVRELRERGVVFEDYDLPEFGIRTVDGISTGEQGGRAAWFRDPAGNIIALMEMPTG